MNRTAFLLTIGAGLLLAAGTANAGICSGEIMALQKQLADIPAVASNPNPDPGAAAPGTETAGAAPSGSSEATPAPEQPDASGGTLVQGVTPVQNGTGADMPDEIAPMDSEAAEAGALVTAAGADPDAAAQSLARAQVLDQAGDEAGCMTEVNEAKGQLGQR